MRPWVPVAIGLALASCTRAPSTGTAAAPLEAGWSVHDTDGDRVLLARVLPAAPDSDEARLLEVKLLQAGRPTVTPFDGAAFEDVRLVPGGPLAAVTRAHALVLSTAPDEALDDRAVAPLDVSRDGRWLAYAAGEPPETEIARYDLRGRQRHPVTRGMAPAWSPALSPDGARVAFVSGAGGHPAVYVAAAGGAPVQVTNLDPKRDAAGRLQLAPFPAGPDAPRFDGTTLRFTGDDRAEHTLDLGGAGK